MNEWIDEEGSLLRHLRDGIPDPTFQDDLHRRIARSTSDPRVSDLDLAVLLRQLSRRMSLRDGREVPIVLSQSIADSVRGVAGQVGLRERGERWFAEPWEPEWLDTAAGRPDAAALAGTPDGHRLHGAPIIADPFFTELTGYATYRTAGQRAACRAAMSVSPGSTIIAVLPTGSGKTEIALCLAGRRRAGVTVVVVPTVALAYDFERRFREHYARRNPRIRPESLNFAWTASTDDGTRTALRSRIEQGQQPILVTSPESLTRSLRQTLMNSASGGRLLGFVVDEAHLVTQWGRDFRPEFRTLADLRRDLIAAAEGTGDSQPITLLLSATVGDAELRDLSTLFGGEGPANIVMANALRPEPDLWIAHTADRDERERWVLETLAHSARPLVMYVTKPEIAEEWARRLRVRGYRAIAQVTGRTPARDRAAVLEGMRANVSASTPIDVVVATSAFGLGIDYPHIRTVVHACLPETVDRWYQELGRGGRDGDAAAAFLLTAKGDRAEAESLRTTVLSADIARKRWRDLWDHRRTLGERVFVDIEGSRGVGRGDYNRRWNAQLVQGLVELGDLKREQWDVEDIRVLNSDSVATTEWTGISLQSARLGRPEFWTECWEPWQRSESARSNEALGRISDLANLRVAACEGIAQAYAPSSSATNAWGAALRFMQPLGPCGRCPGCRAAGISPNTDPPPAPDQDWAVPVQDADELRAFSRAAHAKNGLVLLTYAHDSAERSVHAITRGLIGLGVRHFAGLDALDGSGARGYLFVDERPASPSDLTPFASFSYFKPGDRVSARWMTRRASERINSSGVALVDTLLVPDNAVIRGRRVGRDLPALAIETAIELLGVK